MGRNTAASQQRLTEPRPGPTDHGEYNRAVPALPLRLRPVAAVAVAAAVVGATVAFWYARLGLALSHYDARGHLVVSRRIFDSITPGWQQIGAVWLPLPHLLNALPVQIDLFYRTGASGIAISVVSFAVTVAAIVQIVTRLTGSWLAATAGALVFALNPNVLYLQATPMTEPLLMALLVAALALLLTWCDDVLRAARDQTPVQRRSTVITGIVFALACLTRYEAWPVTVSAFAGAVWVLWRRGLSLPSAGRAIGPVAVYPLAAIIGFSVFSRIVVGAWFASGFFVPENPAQGQPWEAVKEIAWGLRELSGVGLVVVAVAGAAVLAGTGLLSRGRAAWILPLALFATASVPWSAFVDGHPYRIRYMVPLIAAQAVSAGVGAGSWRRSRGLLAAALLVLCAYELRPLDSASPMVAEAQWDRPNIAARQRVTSCLQAQYRGDSIMASMGSLGHYMQDLSRAGFPIRDFLHEGNGDIWLNALYSPRPFAGWILIEEKAEGGDMLAQIARQRPGFLDGYVRVCEAAGVALFRRQ